MDLLAAAFLGVFLTTFFGADFLAGAFVVFLVTFFFGANFLAGAFFLVVVDFFGDDFLGAALVDDFLY